LPPLATDPNYFPPVPSAMALLKPVARASNVERFSATSYSQPRRQLDATA